MRVPVGLLLSGQGFRGYKTVNITELAPRIYHAGTYYVRIRSISTNERDRAIVTHDIVH
jgi:hypothetical protein